MFLTSKISRTLLPMFSSVFGFIASITSQMAVSLADYLLLVAQQDDRTPTWLGSELE